MLRQGTKAARKAARATIGKLEHVGHGKERQKRNLKAAATFLAWAVACGFPLGSDNAGIGEAMMRYVCDCWHEGEGRDGCTSAIYGCVMLLQLNSRETFQASWKLLKRWSKLELPMQAPPALRSEVVAIAGKAWQQNLRGLALGVLLAFDLFLRTGEWIHLLLENVEGSAQCLTIHLGETKGVKRRGGIESVVCRDPALCALVIRHRAAKGNGRLIELDESALRDWLRKTSVGLGLAHRKLTPYSFRRGGLSAAAADGVAVSTLALRARWQDAKVASVYIQEGKAAVAATRTSASTTALLQEASSHFGR